MKLESEPLLAGSWAGARAARSESLPDNDVAETSPLAFALQHLIDDLPEQVALVDQNLEIIAVNRSWTEAMASYGYSGVAPGDNYRAVCERHAATGYEAAIRALDALDQIVAGKCSEWRMNFQGRGEWSDREYQISFHRVAAGSQWFITITRSEVTEIAELRRLKEDFTKSLIEGQAAERQRLGRELHDSTAQVLTALGLVLCRLKIESPSEEWLETVKELQELVAEAQREIRAVTYLAYPPALRSMTLAEALQALVQGFARRTGIDTSFTVRGETDDLPEVVRIALYRVGQEALSNVYRHASAASARMTMCFKGPFVHLVVADDGIGISAETLSGRGSAGVGLTGMRSRLIELGGRLSVLRLAPGTAIIASLRNIRN